MDRTDGFPGEHLTPEDRTITPMRYAERENLKIVEQRLAETEARLDKLERWARLYANPLLRRALNFNELNQTRKGVPLTDPSPESDQPDLEARKL